MTATAPPPEGRCQHCHQTRPLWRHDGELHMWGHNPTDTAWLCSRCWSRREEAIEDGSDIAIHRSVDWIGTTSAS